MRTTSHFRYCENLYHGTKLSRRNFSIANCARITRTTVYSKYHRMIIFSGKYMTSISILQDCLKPICFVSLSLVPGYSIYIANLALLSVDLAQLGRYCVVYSVLKKYKFKIHKLTFAPEMLPCTSPDNILRARFR